MSHILFRSPFQPIYGTTKITKEEFTDKLNEEIKKLKEAEQNYINSISSLIELENPDLQCMLKFKIKNLLFNSHIQEIDDKITIGALLEISNDKEKLTVSVPIVFNETVEEETVQENPING